LAADDIVGIKKEFAIVAPIPVLYLMGHSIELSLKAYLLHKGESLQALRYELKHDLERCLRRAQELDLETLVSLEQGQYQAFIALNELYKTKQLEYSVVGMKEYPILGALEVIAKKLLWTIGPIVDYNHPRFETFIDDWDDYKREFRERD